MNHSTSDPIVLNSPPNEALAKKLRVVVWVLTIAVWGLGGLMRRPEKIPLPEGVSLSFLPPVHAILNTLVALFLVAALVMVKRKKIAMHRNFIAAAMACSAVFLLCYVAYHFTTAETKFGGQGAVRVIYFVLLISHIVFAAVSLPFILQTWVYAFTNHFAKHRKMARWVFPIWLYVAVTGPICYLMLRPYY
jgi:putative membrane protein